MSLQRGPVARRRSGVLLHPTSLPGGPGNGDLGPDAYRFADFLAEAGFSVWQTLPLGPTHEDGSPYNSLSAHAGNPGLVALEPLVEAGWLGEDCREGNPGSPGAFRRGCLERAHAGFRRLAGEEEKAELEDFRAEQDHWLEDFALFMALREEHQLPWWEWPVPIRDREPEALERARERHASEIAFHRFVQWCFARQWGQLKAYANGLGIRLFGDLPIFVARDSAEVWANRDWFALEPQGQPETVAGVPPDYFSETGQYWGNPHYRWDRLAEDGYRWWIERMRSQLSLFDWVRIDHFRGFEAYWEIPYDAPATEGRWVPGPGDGFFAALEEALGDLPLVAEDLGVITPEVTALRQRFGMPGMKVLQFAFGGGADNPFLPHNQRPDYIVYTGTHDNNTTLGWWREEIPEEVRERVRDYLGHPGEAMPWPLIRTALASVAQVAVIPMQDLLGLGAEARMNTPATVEGNWGWRLKGWEQVPGGLAASLRRVNELYGRLPTED